MQIVVTSPQGAEMEVAVREGQTLLDAVVDAGVEGLVGECGGCCSCATCHCYIDLTQLGLLAPPDSSEAQMLDFVASERREGSRLACQVKLTAGMAGLRVAMPDKQF